MLKLTCPWCDEDALLSLRDLQAPEATFTCADCGTTVEFVAEKEAVLDQAA